MIDTGAIRKKILHLAVQGALTERAFDDGDAAVLLQAAKEDRALLIKDGIVKKEKPFPDIKDEQKRFDLPVGWTWCYLNEIAFVTKLAGFEYTKYIAEAITTDGIPLFKGKNIQNSNIVLEFESFIPEEVSDSLKRSQLTRKCLLTPYVGTIGNIAIFDGSFKAHLGSNVGKIELFNYSGMHILDEYICYYLKSDYGYLELTKHKKATAQDSISIDAIRDVIVPLPPLAEQQRIVERVESIFSLLDEIDAAQAEYKKDFSSVVEKVITAAILGKLDDYSVEAESVSKAFPQLVELQESLKDENLQLPEQWLWARLSDIVPDGKINDGNWVLSADMVKAGPVKLIQLGNIGNRTYIEKGYKYLTEEHFKELNGRQIYKDYLLINRLVGDRMVACILPEIDGILMTAVDVCWIAPDEKYDLEYIMYALTSEYIQKKVKSLGRGVTRFRISKLNLIDIPFPLPPISVQRKIVSMIKNVQTLCS